MFVCPTLLGGLGFRDNWPSQEKTTQESSAALLTGQGSQEATSSNKDPLKTGEEIMEIAVRDIDQIKEMLATEFEITRPWEGKPDSEGYIEALGEFANYVNLYNDIRAIPAHAKMFRIPLQADIDVRKCCGLLTPMS